MYIFDSTKNFFYSSTERKKKRDSDSPAYENAKKKQKLGDKPPLVQPAPRTVTVSPKPLDISEVCDWKNDDDATLEGVMKIKSPIVREEFLKAIDKIIPPAHKMEVDQSEVLDDSLPFDVNEWTPHDVQQWLKTINGPDMHFVCNDINSQLSRFVAINGVTLMRLTHEKLTDLGFTSLYTRETILEGIKEQKFRDARRCPITEWDCETVKCWIRDIIFGKIGGNFAGSIYEDVTGQMLVGMTDDKLAIDFAVTSPEARRQFLEAVQTAIMAHTKAAESADFTKAEEEDTEEYSEEDSEEDSEEEDDDKGDNIPLSQSIRSLECGGMPGPPISTPISTHEQSATSANELKELLQKYEDCKKQPDVFESENSELSKHTKELEAKQTATASKMQILAQQVKKARTLKKQAEDLTSQNESLRRHLDEYQQKVKELREKNRKLRAQKAQKESGAPCQMCSERNELYMKLQEKFEEVTEQNRKLKQAHRSAKNTDAAEDAQESDAPSGDAQESDAPSGDAPAEQDPEEETKEVSGKYEELLQNYEREFGKRGTSRDKARWLFDAISERPMRSKELESKWGKSFPGKKFKAVQRVLLKLTKKQGSVNHVWERSSDGYYKLI